MSFRFTPIPSLSVGLTILAFALGTAHVDARPVGPHATIPASSLGGRTAEQGLRVAGSEAASGAVVSSRAVGDTLGFGYVDGDGFAVPGELWTFDHGGPDPLEGVLSIDATESDGPYGRHISASVWGADPDNPPNVPVLSGSGSAWIGAFEGEADAACWVGGIGYGNDWAEKLVSPVMSRSPGALVEVEWVHFNETEELFDYSRVYVELLPGLERVDLAEYTGTIGLAPNHPTDAPTGVADGAVLTDADFLGATEFRVVFEVTSDGSWSDEDGMFGTDYGAAGLDDVVLTEQPSGTVLGAFGFEADLEGWTPDFLSPLGTEFGVAPLSDYLILDTCGCGMSGNVIEMHDENGEHPRGQHEILQFPPIDVLNDVTPFLSGDPDRFVLFAEWDQYAGLPRAGGVFYRTLWQYYPYTCEATGEPVWSPPVGQPTFFFTGEVPECVRYKTSGSGNDVVPGDAEQVRFLYELYASCDAFGIPPEDCEGTNETPLLDNIQIRFTEAPVAPQIGVDYALSFQDGFCQGSAMNDPHRPGRADVTRMHSFGALPYVLADSLAIGGPVVTSPDNQWEARLWFRVARLGPGADGNYAAWKNGVASARGVDIEAGEFAYGWMDSCQLGTQAFRNKFASYLREDEWAAFGRSGPELSDDTEIIPDDVLFPGTQIEYFLSSNYLNGNGDQYLLPDTTGGFFSEFEILPRWTQVGEHDYRHPCVLYVDMENAGAQYYIEQAMDAAGIAHDRYDYLSSTGSAVGPLARGLDGVSNNGCTLLQLMGYRGVFVSSGRIENSTIGTPGDYQLFSDFLTSSACEGVGRRGLIVNGIGAAMSVENQGAALAVAAGVSLLDPDYGVFSGDPGPCTELEAPGTAAYGTSNSGGSYDYDVYGDGCVSSNGFDVLSSVGSGVGNRVYVDAGNGGETEFAQIVNDVAGGTEYRTVFDGTSWHVLTERDPSGNCEVTTASRVAAAANELQAAVEWIYGVGALSGLCEDDCRIVDPADAPGFGDAAATRLYQSTPNPFHPMTTLRFSLAQDGPAKLTIFDVSGRQIRTLVDGVQAAGPHEVVWDGRSDRGEPVASGTYWARLEFAGYSGSSRMVLLK
ncbi:MAG: FlgD immunoglobulin-like domain containing protein [Candidatus Eisenbacteria bacterium]